MAADHILPACDLSDLNHTWLDQDIIEPIAVIGLSLKFPQEAKSSESFWGMLVEGRSAMTDVPNDRFNIDAFYHPDNSRPGTMPVKGGHFIKEDLGAFDAPFFAITPAEAACLDPQQRWLLETSYRALENAGIPMEQCLGSKTSVYNGSFTGDYTNVVMSDPEQEVTHAATGLATSMLANRISWFFDFKGPSVNLDTACSSSLMALHTACQGLRDGEASMSLVAGSNLVFHPDFMFVMSKMSFLSPDSRCYSFDHRANGYARGEGIGVVVIKRLVDALRDGDTVRAVIRSTGANQDGRTTGITQPNGEAQEELIRNTYHKAGLDMRHTRYFEAHGTGTSIGDPIEANAIGHCFSRYRTVQEPLYVGAVKSNIGHLEGASGIAGLIKTIMVLEEGIIPPNINFEKVNPQIDLESLCIRLPLECTPWPTPGLRRASVNSFGFGGANAHVVLDDACHYLGLRNLKGQHNSVQEPRNLNADSGAGSSPCQGPQRLFSAQEGIDVESVLPKAFVVSAADEGGIVRVLKSYQDYFKVRNPSIDATFIKNLVYTLASRRSHLEWRSYILIRQTVDLLNLETSPSKPIRANTVQRLAFIFTGQGAQYARMGLGLLRYEVFRQSLEDADAFFKNLGSDWSLMTILTESPEHSVITEPEYSQPICTALQIALIALLETFNILPSAVLGHSSGEIAAAYCIGALSRTSAWRLAYYRGKMAASLASFPCFCGTMISVGISEQQANLYLTKLGKYYKQVDVSIGCINSPKNVTLTGDVDQVNRLKEWMQDDSVAVHRLRVNVAYHHSPHMNEIADQYLFSIKQIEPGDATTVPMISSVSGARVSEDKLSHAEYWVQNLVSPVQFLKALTILCTKMAKKRRRLGHVTQHQININDILEIGPHSALKGPIQESLRVIPEGGDIRYHWTLSRHSSAVESILEAASRLYCSGFPVDFLSVHNQKETSSGTLLVDLPEYPFNHTQSHWLEGRASKSFRFRHKARSDLLGTPASDWSHLNAQWRNIIRKGENPWIEDHQIEGVCLYPAAGMLVMAIEAAKQVADEFRSGTKVTGFQIENATFSKALRIPSLSKGVETRFHLRPMKGSSDPQRVWSEYLLLVLENEEWAECCRGHIRTEYEAFTDEVDGGAEARKTADYYRQSVEDGLRACNETMSANQLYDILSMAGAQYGPTFKALKNLTYSNLVTTAAAEIELQQWAVLQKIVYEQPHVIHPTTLDGLFQLIVPAISNGGKGKLSTMVPTQIQKLWISSTGLSGSKSSVRAVASCQIKGYREVESSIIAVSGTGEPCIIFEAVDSTFVSTDFRTTGSMVEDNHICCSIEWKPDLEMLSHEQVLNYCEKSRPERRPLETFYRNLKLLIFFYINDALRKIDEDTLEGMQPHLVKYVEWMRHQIRQYESGNLQIHLGDWERLEEDKDFRQNLIHLVEETSNEGKLYVNVGRHLCDILHGRVDALDLLYKGDLAKAYYEELHGDPATIAPLNAYLDALGHKSPSSAILEIGAGTGGATLPILGALALDGSKVPSVRCSRYDFTDISPSFFQSARDKFQKYLSKMNFNILDIEKPPSQQGFENETYDIVIASNVLHATKDLDLALQNTRKLLRPGGKLVLFEVTEPHIMRTGFAFGLLKGWWLAGDDSRKWSPMLTATAWKDALVKAGFSGIDLLIPDHKSPECHESSIMISTAVLKSTPVASLLSQVNVVLIAETEIQLSLAGDLREVLIRTHHSGCEIYSLDHAAARLDKTPVIYVFLLEIDQPFLSVLNEHEFDSLQRIVCADKDILWVSRDSTSDPRRPEFEMVTGFARALRSEYTQSKFSTLTLANGAETSSTSILTVLEATVSSALEEYEAEYRERDGLYEISRIMKAEQLNHTLEAKLAPEKMAYQSCGSTAPISLNIRAPGLLDSMEFREDPKGLEALSVDEVEVMVEATGVNFRDCLLALGQLPETALGLECAGVVQRCGNQVSRLRNGDRVIVCTMGTYQSHVRAKDLCVAKIPNNISFVEAASLPVTALTAIYSLCNIARLRSGEKILIHNGAGGMGQMAIQIAQYLRADIYTTVGSEEKRALLQDVYGIPQEKIFSSRNSSFAQGIKQMTQGRGVDVILSSLSGEGLKASWECISSFGRFIEIGKQSISSNENLQMAHFARNTSFAAVDLIGLIRERPELLQELLQRMIELLNRGYLRPAQPIQIFSVSEISQALRFLQGGRNKGKAVIEWKKGVQIPTILKNRFSCQFSTNATYVIAGGLGGLGRSLARWMARCGARHLILLSRSGPKAEAAAELLAELVSQGVQVSAPACDITDREALRQALNESGKEMPPVKGCIQSTMVLRDTIFSNMSYSDFTESTRPKVAGSWNLHSLLPRGLDFFILLSSICGIFGAATQANYCAGNTYKDALAHYRTGLGEKAVSIDLGMMIEEGVVAENDRLMRLLTNTGYFIPISQAKLFALLDYYCDPALPVLSPRYCQPVVGIEIPAVLSSRGVDHPYWMRRPLFRHFYQMTSKSASSSAGSKSLIDPAPDYAALLSAAAAGGGGVQASAAVVMKAIARKMSLIMGVRSEEIASSKPAHAYGVDSLIAVEIKSWLSKELGADVPVFDILGSDSLASLSLKVAAKSKFQQTALDG